MNQDRTKRKLTAILSADVVGYSRLMEEDEDWTIKTLEENKALISEFIEEYKGRVVDAPGDNILAEFNSVTNAVECAVEIQRELKSKNTNLAENRRMEFRIGVNLGEVVEEDGRIYGSGVNIAARLEGLTAAGGICISRRTYDHVKTQLDLSYEYLGEQCVKNISEPIRVYRILMDSKIVGRVIGEKRFLGKISRQTAITIIIILIIIAAGLFCWILYAPQFMEEKELKTIAVLPFENFSPEKEQEYFVDGLTGEIISYLSNISGLNVTSSTSSFAFKNTEKTIKEIAEILGREYILEGNVKKAKNSLRITVQLINVADDRNLWSETYDHELKDIFIIQEDIANKVAEKLKLTLEAFNILGGTENIEAYDLYLKAKSKRDEANMPGYKSSLDLIDKAIELDPEFAVAWAYKANIHHLLNIFGPYNKAIAEAEAGIRAAKKAIEIEPNLSDGYIYLGWIKAFKSEWFEAELNYHKALELIGESLSYDDVFIVPYYLAVGKFKRAYGLLEEMRQNDPIDEAFRWWYYHTYVFLGDRQRAEEAYQHSNKLLLKDYSDWHDEAITQVRLGSGDILFSEEIVSSDPIHITLKEYLDSPEEGLVELRRIYHNGYNLTHMNQTIISLWAAYLGAPKLAMDAIEKNAGINAAQSHFWYPVMREVRKMPRFKRFIRDIGLVDYWNKFGWPDNNLCHPVGDEDFECD